VTKEEKQDNNTKVFKEQGPRLSYGYKTWIIAKDTKHGRVLIGGLGGMGVGQMWFKVGQENLDDPEYLAAPEVELHGEAFW